MSETISHVAGDASRSALHHVVALPGAVKRASDQGHVKLPNSRKDEKLSGAFPRAFCCCFTGRSLEPAVKQSDP